ncbi:MAG TPA: hypothetical protein EYH05_16095 [Anaerolineae bacterium]|nr:hypothetical protein [Anaerolineae bacterium]
MKKTFTSFFLILLSFLIIGCSSTIPTPTSSNKSDTPTLPPVNKATESTGTIGYPGTVVNESEVYPAYPATSEEKETLPYPVKEERIDDESKRIAFDKPVVVDTTIVSGNGPANIAIRIVSVSNVGESLGSGIIDADGTFEITLSRQLESKEAIAIMLADNSLRPDFLNAPGATDIPMLGFMLDMAITESGQ